MHGAMNQKFIHSLHLHFIKVQSLDMFRALLAHLPVALPERRFCDLCAVADVGWSRDVGTLRDQPTSTTAHNSHQTCVRVVSPEDGQVMHKTCRNFES
jgi:hypothetical protein